MRHIFVSYARRDKAFVDKLARDLRAASYTLWLDREREAELASGVTWHETIVEAIEACSVFLLILSDKSARSDVVWDEFDIAKDSDQVLKTSYTFDSLSGDDILTTVFFTTNSEGQRFTWTRLS